MFWSKNSSLHKAKRVQEKGDRLFAEEKFEEAFKAYEKSWQLNSERAEIYPKLIQSFEKLERPWTQEDFERTLDWTMRQQELENPEIKQVHKKFTPEYQAIQRLIQQFLITPTEEESQELREKILNQGELAILALLDFLQTMKDSLPESSDSFSDEELKGIL